MLISSISANYKPKVSPDLFEAFPQYPFITTISDDELHLPNAVRTI